MVLMYSGGLPPRSIFAQEIQFKSYQSIYYAKLRAQVLEKFLALYLLILGSKEFH
jgi:hypothetical protein